VVRFTCGCVGVVAHGRMIRRPVGSSSSARTSPRHEDAGHLGEVRPLDKQTPRVDRLPTWTTARSPWSSSSWWSSRPMHTHADAVAGFRSEWRKLRTAPPNVAASAGLGGGQSGRHGLTALRS